MNRLIYMFALVVATHATAETLVPIAGCTQGSFVDGGQVNQIAMARASYTPKCLRVKVGSSVTIQASAHHPLSAMPDINGAANPFASSSPARQSVTQIMSQPGFFGYFCEAHGDAEGDGMAGIILVEQ